MMLDQPARTTPPKNWLLESILVTLFCCLPLGIVGIVNAAKVEPRFYAGDFEAADLAAAEAKKWTMIGFWIGLGFVVLYFIFVGFTMFFALSNGGLKNMH
jgi:hypothetical protein